MAEAPNADLSPAQEKLLDSVFEDFGDLGRWELVKITHQLPEWSDPHGSSVPILISDVLRGGKFEEDDIVALENDLAGDDLLTQLAS